MEHPASHGKRVVDVIHEVAPTLREGLHVERFEVVNELWLAHHEVPFVPFENGGIAMKLLEQFTRTLDGLIEKRVVLDVSESVSYRQAKCHKTEANDRMHPGLLPKKQGQKL
jgi:hypothetical protein